MALKRALDGSGTLLVLDGVDAIDGLGGCSTTSSRTPTAGRLLCTATTVAGQAHEQRPAAAPAAPSRSPAQPLEGPALELLLARVAAAGGHDRRPRRSTTQTLRRSCCGQRWAARR